MQIPGRSGLSLRSALFLLLILGMLPLLLFGSWSIYQSSMDRQADQSRHLTELARALSSAVDAELDSVISSLHTLASLPDLEERGFEPLYVAAKEMAYAQQDWASVLLSDSNGQLVFWTTAPFGRSGGVVADPSSLRRLFETHTPTIGRTVRGPLGNVAFPVRISLRDRAGRMYALTAAVRADRILRLIQRQNVRAESIISIVDATGTIVARSRNHEQTAGGPASGTLRKLIAVSPFHGQGRTMSIEKGATNTAVHRTRHDWIVAVGGSTATIKSSLSGHFVQYAWVIAGSVLVFVGLATALATYIANAFQRVQAAALSLGEGRSVTIATCKINEVNFISEALQLAAAQHARHEAALRELVQARERALDEALAARRVRDDFLALLGHELRNPLSPIVAALDLMDLQQSPAFTRERTIMRRQVLHLKRLVDDLLDVSRIVSGRFNVSRQRINLSEVVQDACDAVPAERIEHHLAEGVWVDGDEVRLGQVLTNLLSNAQRFSAAPIVVERETREQSAILSVIDRGIGMDGELLAKVFEPFVQGTQQLARTEGGLGLGLAIVKSVVELHGGTVRAYSAGHDMGSRFDICLPLASSPVMQMAAATGPPSAGSVLIVDDNYDAAFTTAALLEALGLAVLVAHSADEAIALFETHAPDFVFMDIGLPDMDGYQLAHQLRHFGRGDQVRLIALTGYGTREDVKRAFAASFDRHLTKPASVHDLKRALN